MGSEVGRELETYKLAVVRDGAFCAASARGDPVRPACLSTTNLGESSFSTRTGKILNAHIARARSASAI